MQGAAHTQALRLAQSFCQRAAPCRSTLAAFAGRVFAAAAFAATGIARLVAAGAALRRSAGLPVIGLACALALRIAARGAARAQQGRSRSMAWADIAF